MDASEIDERISHYYRRGYTQAEIRASLSIKDDVWISERQLKRHLRRLGLFRRKFCSDIAAVAIFIASELETYGQLHGYRMMHLKCRKAGLTVSRETVSFLLQILDKEGVNLRRKGNIVRRCYLSKGPNFVWHLDSYDKLKPYGICVNGCIDGFSRKLIWLEAYRTSSDPKVIGGYYLTAVAKRNGCPVRVRGDLGTENATVCCLQQFLRRSGVDRWAGENSFLYRKSTGS